MSRKSIKIAAVPEPHADVCATVEAICWKFPAKYWRELESAPLSARYPEAFFAELEQAGIAGASITEAFGGIGLAMSALARIIETVHASGCNADALTEQWALSVLLARHAGDHVQHAILPRLAEGKERLQTLAIWEPGSGRDPARIKATATPCPGGYSIDGRKRWARFADGTTLMMVAARTGSDGKAISMFLVDLADGRDQITIAPIDAMNNFGAAEVTFNGLVIPEASLIGSLNAGLACLDDLDTVRGILAAAAARGCSRFFCTKGVSYANERVVFGNPIGKYQGIQFPLAQTYIESEGAALLLELAIGLYDQGRPCFAEARMAHHMAVQAAWDTAEASFTTHGGFAFAREYDVERKWREVRFMRNEAVTALAQLGDDTLGVAV